MVQDCRDSIFTRAKLEILVALLRIHIRRWALAYVSLAMLATWFHENYTLGLNATDSLKGTLFLIERHRLPERGELVAFEWRGDGHYPAGTTFIKVLKGTPGDTVSQDQGQYSVNGEILGLAKPLDRQGRPLHLGPTGTLPPGRFFVWAPHPDSMDSRYAETGWVNREQILGRARVLF